MDCVRSVGWNWIYGLDSTVLTGKPNRVLTSLMHAFRPCPLPMMPRALWHRDRGFGGIDRSCKLLPGQFLTFFCLLFRCDSISQHLPLSVSEWISDSFRFRRYLSHPPSLRACYFYIYFLLFRCVSISRTYPGQLVGFRFALSVSLDRFRFPKSIFPKCIFPKCTQLMHLLSLVSLFTFGGIDQSCKLLLPWQLCTQTALLNLPFLSATPVFVWQKK